MCLSPLLKDFNIFCSDTLHIGRYICVSTWSMLETLHGLYFCYYFPSFPVKSVGVLWKTVAHLAVMAPVRISPNLRKKLDANQKPGSISTIPIVRMKLFFVQYNTYDTINSWKPQYLCCGNVINEKNWNIMGQTLYGFPKNPESDFAELLPI